MTGLTVSFRVVVNVIVMGEVVDGGTEVMTGYTERVIQCVLMFCGKGLIKFFGMAICTSRRILGIASRVMADPAVFLHGLNMTCVVENNFAPLVVKQGAYRWTVGTGWNYIASDGNQKEDTCHDGDGKIPFLQCINLWILGVILFHS